MATDNYNFPIPNGNDSFKAHRDLKALGEAVDNTIKNIETVTQETLDTHYVNIENQRYYQNPKTFGAIGNGINDDTIAFQSAVNAGDVFVEPGTYLIDPTTPIMVPSNRTLILSRGATLKVKTNGADSYHVIRLFDVENVTIEGGGKIIGDRDTHLGTTGESGMGVSIYGSKNILIKELQISKMWGDGIYIGRSNANPQSTNVTLQNLVIDRVRRNGIAIISVDGLRMKNIDISNVSGVLPEAGIDFEPNYITEWITNVTAEDIKISDTNGHGVVFGLGGISGTKSDLFLNFKNVITMRTRTGLYMTFGNITSPIGSVVFQDLTSVDAKENGILIEKWSGNLPKLKMIRPVIRNANSSTTTGYKANALTIRNASGDTWNVLSNIDIIEPIIENDANRILNGISVSPAVNTLSNINISDPRFSAVTSSNKIVLSNGDKSVRVRDAYEELTLFAPDLTVTTIENQRIIKKVDTSSFTAKRTIELDTTITEGKQITITSGTSFGVSVWFDSSIALPLQPTVNGRLETTQKGASLTVYRESFGWRIVAMVGTWNAV